MKKNKQNKTKQNPRLNKAYKIGKIFCKIVWLREAK